MCFSKLSVTSFKVVNIDSDYVGYEYCCSNDGVLVSSSTRFNCIGLLPYCECLSSLKYPIAVLDCLSKLNCDDNIAIKILDNKMSVQGVENFLKLTCSHN